ncbi:MAG: radical SAM protein [Selenomonadaceae bacterium]|nr:radical SAM protein [Selenomonadaceae bacterium]
MPEIFAKALSVCPVCLKTIPTNKVVGADGFIHMEKECPEHGPFDALLWEGHLESYQAWGGMPSTPVTPAGARPTEKGCPYDCGLCEAHWRDGCCVLLEVTSRCNLRCPVCFASAREGTAQEDPGLEEIGKLYDMLMERGGPFNIQLSGGEPTLRDDLDEIIALGMEKGFTFFQLNTNGLRIAEEEGYAGWLSRAGVSCVFLQFDGLRDSDYEALRGKQLLSQKLRIVKACEKAGLPVVLVPTIAPGINEDSVGSILDFALSHAPHVRGVHFQPISYFGRCDLPAVEQKRITLPRILGDIEKQTEGRMKTSDFHGGGAESPYCSFHAAYRLGADGTIKALAKKNSGCCCGPSIPDEEPCCSDAEASCCAETEPCCSEAETSCCSEAEPCCNEVASCCTETTVSCCGTEQKTARTVRSSEARDFVAQQWGARTSCCEDVPGTEASSLDAFLEEAVRQTFTVSGMLFQDAGNLELERLKRCYICETDPERGMVPFCAYNLTDTSGRALYRKGRDAR